MQRQHRARMLNRLGMYKVYDQQGEEYLVSRPFVPPSKKVLACHRCEPCTWPSRDEESNIVTPPSSPRGKVQFSNVVQVVDIPSIAQYSSQERSLLWNSRRQLRYLARKNTLEYSYEKFNWRDAVEEEEFYSIQGRLIHPVHVKRQQKERRLQQLNAWNAEFASYNTGISKLAERQEIMTS